MILFSNLLFQGEVEIYSCIEKFKRLKEELWKEIHLPRKLFFSSSCQKHTLNFQRF